jgi:hypothetical protein
MGQKDYDIFREMMDSPGMQFVNRMRAHSFSVHIFSGNLSELKKGMALIEHPEIGIKLFHEKNREQGDQAYRDINRIFHNFLASAKTLVDHTRIFIETYYKNTPMKHSYSAKIKTEYAEDGLCRFVQDLRNFMLHKGLPHSNMSLTYTKDSPTIETTISLDKEKLLTWDKWSSRGRLFLNEQEERIKLSDLSEEYGNKIHNLYQWFHEKLHKYHSKELKELDRLQKLYKQMTETPNN